MGTEHLLLALLRERDPRTLQALTTLGLDAGLIAAELDRLQSLTAPALLPEDLEEDDKVKG